MRLLALVLIALACSSACRRGPAPSKRPAPTGAAASGRSAQKSGEVERALTELRQSVISVAPRPVPAQRFAFGRKELVWARDDEVVAYAAEDGRELARWPAQGAHRALSLADGSLLVLRSDRTDLWRPGRDRPESYARVPMFPEAVLFGDRAQAEKIWLKPSSSPTLYGFELARDAGPILHIQSTVQAEGFERGVFASLRDGSFLYRAGTRLRRFFPGGRSSDVVVPPELGPVRVLPSARLDRVWLIGERGTLVLAELGSRVRPIASHDLGRVPFEAAAVGGGVAVVTVSRERGATDFVLELYDAKAQKQRVIALPRDHAPPGTREVARIISENQNVVGSEHAALVAVGGPKRLCVWRTETGERLWCAGAGDAARSGEPSRARRSPL